MSAERVSVTLDVAAGIDLAGFREGHVRERVQRALARERIPGEQDLAVLLRRDAVARSRFRRSVAVSVSGLFRDPEQFALLEQELLPPLLGAGRIRVWSAGCADGSELYSLGLLLERLGMLESAFLLGSDLLEENVAQARGGAAFGPDASAEVRARMRWEQRDLLADGPVPGKWQLILCRNVAIYFTAAAKETLHARLAAALVRGGVVLLGRSERINDPGSLGLEPAGPHAYRKAR